MMGQSKNGRRSGVGYGSSYRSGTAKDLSAGAEIGSVLGGQVWMVKPDKEARTSNPCIWMASGVVPFKNCNNFYDCPTCKYDLGMQKSIVQGKHISWQDTMRKREGLDRICRHSLTERIAKRACAHDYQCGTCDFDQFFEDVWSVKSKTLPFEMEEVKGFQIPRGYYYHDGHTWARIESGGHIRVGMDDFALKLLGRADALELPLMGKELGRGKAGWGFHRDDHVADVLSPVDGVILDVNTNIRERPALANERPYEDGWLFVIHNRDVKGTVKPLMTDKEGIEWIEGEVSSLEHMIEEVAGPLAADGGYLAEDIFGHIPDLGWERLAKTFLKS